MRNTTQLWTWPKNTPTFDGIVIAWFNLPGTASTFIPNSGKAQACKTSEEVIKNLIAIYKATLKMYRFPKAFFHLPVNHPRL